MLSAARFGYARLLGKYAVAASSITAADQAVALAPTDPEVHRARARVFNRLQLPAEARKSFEIASRLRYRDDYLWLELGSTRDGLGDTTAALAAFDQAVQWRLTMRTHSGNAVTLSCAWAGTMKRLPIFVQPPLAKAVCCQA